MLDLILATTRSLPPVHFSSYHMYKYLVCTILYTVQHTNLQSTFPPFNILSLCLLYYNIVYRSSRPVYVLYTLLRPLSWLLTI